MSALQLSRVGEYQSRAAMLRRLALVTTYPETKARLMTLADSFEKLASRVADRQTAAVNAAD